MAPIEKIRAEIERLKRQSQEDLQRPEVQGFVIYELVERVKQKTCEQLLSFIASLEVEKYEVEEKYVDLKKEIIRWLDKGDITDTRFDDYNDADIEKTACHFYELGMAVGDLKIKGWVERDMGGQVILTVPHRGAADEYILLENNTFPNLRPDNTRIEVDLIIRKK